MYKLWTGLIAMPLAPHSTKRAPYQMILCQLIAMDSNFFFWLAWFYWFEFSNSLISIHSFLKLSVRFGNKMTHFFIIQCSKLITHVSQKITTHRLWLWVVIIILIRDTFTVLKIVFFLFLSKCHWIENACARYQIL